MQCFVNIYALCITACLKAGVWRRIRAAEVGQIISIPTTPLPHPTFTPHPTPTPLVPAANTCSLPLWSHHFYSELELDRLPQNQRLKKEYHSYDIQDRLIQPVNKVNFPSWKLGFEWENQHGAKDSNLFQNQDGPIILDKFQGSSLRKLFDCYSTAQCPVPLCIGLLLQSYCFSFLLFQLVIFLYILKGLQSNSTSFFFFFHVHLYGECVFPHV